MIPSVQDLQLLKTQLEGPMLWSESYEIKGIHQGTYQLIGDGRPLGQYSDSWYYATCLICNDHNTKQYGTKNEACHQHFYHCAEQHRYVFPEGDEATFLVEDKQLQQAIMLAMEHDLPMPGYEDHSNCIRQHRDSKQICVVHTGNEYRNKTWMGMY
jgi:hypothetical protein